MIVSHQRKFVFFPDPLDGSDALMRGLAPFGDVRVLSDGARSSDSPFAMGMSPAEAEWAFDAMGIAYKSYLRIAVVQNPYARLAGLYDRIAATDPMWTMRKRAGLGQPDFLRWLKSTKPKGYGAGNRHSPRWRRFGAWSARYWCGDHINCVIRKEAVEEDLTQILPLLGIAPGFDQKYLRRQPSQDWRGVYSDAAFDWVQHRYSWDLAQYGYGHPERRRAG